MNRLKAEETGAAVGGGCAEINRDTSTHCTDRNGVGTGSTAKGVSSLDLVGGLDRHRVVTRVQHRVVCACGGGKSCLLHPHLHPLNRQHCGVILRNNQRPLLRREHHTADFSRKQLPLIARAIGAAIEAPIQGVAEFLQQGAGGQVHIQQAVVELVGIHIDALAAGVAAGRIGCEGTSEFVIGAQIHRDLQAFAAQGGQ